MEQATYRTVLTLISTLIFMSAMTVAILLFSTGEKFNKALVEDNNEKASSRYTLAYEDENVYITPADAYYDIMAGDISVPIFLNGTLLSDTVINKARAGEPTAISALKASLSDSRYRKEQTYGPSGSLTAINYIGG